MQPVPSDIFEVYHRAVFGGADPGDYVFCEHDNFKAALCIAGGGSDCVYGADPDDWGVYWVRSWGIFDFDGEPDAGAVLYYSVFCAAADRRKFDLSSCGGEFGGAAFDVGAVCRDSRGEAYGSCGDAGVYSIYVSAVYPIS